MQSEINLLKQQITKLEAKKAELETKNSKLLKYIIEETTKYKVKNDKLKIRIKKLEKGKTDIAVKNVRYDVENTELKAKVVKLKKKFR